MISIEVFGPIKIGILLLMEEEMLSSFSSFNSLTFNVAVHPLSLDPGIFSIFFTFVAYFITRLPSSKASVLLPPAHCIQEKLCAFFSTPLLASLLVLLTVQFQHRTSLMTSLMFKAFPPSFPFFGCIIGRNQTKPLT